MRIYNTRGIVKTAIIETLLILAYYFILLIVARIESVGLHNLNRLKGSTYLILLGIAIWIWLIGLLIRGLTNGIVIYKEINENVLDSDF
jgi:energy-coupling factor transporter transmembrane protein EcfT